MRKQGKTVAASVPAVESVSEHLVSGLLLLRAREVTGIENVYIVTKNIAIQGQKAGRG
jgi:hypothetical protein